MIDQFLFWKVHTLLHQYSYRSCLIRYTDKLVVLCVISIVITVVLRAYSYCFSQDLKMINGL